MFRSISCYHYHHHHHTIISLSSFTILKDWTNSFVKYLSFLLFLWWNTNNRNENDCEKWSVDIPPFRDSLNTRYHVIWYQRHQNSREGQQKNGSYKWNQINDQWKYSSSTLELCICVCFEKVDVSDREPRTLVMGSSSSSSFSSSFKWGNLTESNTSNKINFM